MDASVDNCGLDLFNEELLCIECERIVPNDNFFTEHGCKWCDSNYYLKKEKK